MRVFGQSRSHLFRIARTAHVSRHLGTGPDLNERAHIREYELTQEQSFNLDPHHTLDYSAKMEKIK